MTKNSQTAEANNSKMVKHLANISREGGRGSKGDEGSNQIYLSFILNISVYTSFLFLQYFMSTGLRSFIHVGQPRSDI